MNAAFVDGRWVGSRLRVVGAMLLLGLGGATQMIACSNDEAGTSAAADVDAGPSTGDATADTGLNCPAPAARACTAKKCTADLGEPAVCVADACVKLKTSGCPVVVGPADDDNALLFGAVHDLFGTQKDPGLAGMNAQELAVREINDKGGLRDPDRCKPARPLVMIGCNDSATNPDGSPSAANPDAGAGAIAQQEVVEHLNKDLALPIVTGGTTSGTTLVLNNYGMPKYKNVYLTTRSTSPIFEKAGSPGNAATFNPAPDGTRLFWRATGNAKGQTAAMRLVLAQITEAAKAKYTLSTVKVALLVKNDAFGIGTADAFEVGLNVNGTPAGGSNVNAGYKRIDFRERVGVGLSTQPEQSDAVEQLKTFAPEIIIIIATDEFVRGTTGQTNAGILKPYEDYLRTSGGRKPFYLHSHASIAKAFTNYLNDAANFGATPTEVSVSRKDFLERNRGTNLSEPTQLASAFFNRYKVVFPTPSESIYGMPEAYDATYITAYLYAATFSKGPITALALAQAFPSLVEGAQSIDNGPTGFNAAVQTLTTGGKINYNGAVSPFDWSYETGEAPYNANVWCIQVNQTNGVVFFQQNAGQVWRYQSGNLEGTYSCPQP